jgi:hypothetical protein
LYCGTLCLTVLIHKNKANITQDEDKQELRFASRRSQFLLSFGELDSICTWLFHQHRSLVWLPCTCAVVGFRRQVPEIPRWR